MKLLRTAAVVGLCVLFSSVAFADSITVNNPSFETLPASGLSNGCGSGCSYSVASDPGQAIPGWTTSGFAGQFQPGTSGGFNSLPDGPTVAYVNQGGSISQTLGATVQSGDTYTLTVDVGARNGISSDPLIYLVIGGTDILATGTAPTAGDWSTYTATFTCSDTCTPGESIGILLESLGVSGDQADYDDVQMSVPEPATVSMLVLGLMGLLAFGWRRKHAGVALS